MEHFIEMTQVTDEAYFVTGTRVKCKCGFDETFPVPDRDFNEKLEHAHSLYIEKREDPVNHPSHYTAYTGLEIIDLVEQMNFCKGNAVKYIARAGLKDPGTEIQDLEKAKWYIEREIERVKGNSNEAT